MPNLLIRSLPLLLALPVAHVEVAARGPNCRVREGHCIAVNVNGQTSVKLGRKTRALLRDLKATSLHGTETRYELPAPIRGGLDVKAAVAAGGAAWFGAAPEPEITVAALQHVDVKTRREQTTDESVRVSGSAAVREHNVLEGNRLPPGKYLMVVRLRGSANWDRQVLFFEVAGE